MCGCTRVRLIETDTKKWGVAREKAPLHPKLAQPGGHFLVLLHKLPVLASQVSRRSCINGLIRTQQGGAARRTNIKTSRPRRTGEPFPHQSGFRSAGTAPTHDPDSLVICVVLAFPPDLSATRFPKKASMIFTTIASLLLAGRRGAVAQRV